MFFQSKMTNALSAAGTVLTAREKLTKEISVQVSKLSTLLADQVEAKTELEDAVAREVLGEPNDAGKARKRLAAIAADIQGVGSVLAGLRRMTAAQVPQLHQAHGKISAEMDAHKAQVRSDFEREWSEASSRFAAVLGRRAAIERLLGTKLSLQSPVAVQADISELAQPSTRLQELGEAIAAAAGNPPYEEPDPKGLLARHVPGETYRMRVFYDDSNGAALQPGDLITDFTFGPGVGRHIVRIGHAVPLTGPELESAQEVALAAELDAKRNVPEAISPMLHAQ